MPLRSKGFAVVFASSGYSFRIVDVNPRNEEVEDVDVTHQGSDTHREYEPGTFIEGGETTLKIHHDSTLTVNVGNGGSTETVTVTYPLPTGKTTPAQRQFPGYIKSYNETANLGAVIEAEVVVKVAGKPTYTPAS